MWYGEVKTFIETYTGLERDALHIHAAILLYLVSMGICRKSRHSRIPWLIVLGVELANEAYDIRQNWSDFDWAVASSFRDLWNTMLWPTVLLFLGRYTTWFPRRRDTREAPVEGDMPPSRKPGSRRQPLSSSCGSAG